jgi:hypothetical protein
MFAMSRFFSFHNLDLCGARFCPTENDPPLVIHSNRIFTAKVASESLEPVPGWNCEVAQRLGMIHLEQFP